MDITQLNTRDPSEEGAFLHLKHPALKHLLYHGDNVDQQGKWKGEGEEPEKVGLVVKGQEAPTIRAHMSAFNKQKMKKEFTEEENNQEARNLACALTTKFVHLYEEGQLLDGGNQAHKEMFFAKSEDLVIQVTRFARDSRNFFVPVKTD